jgi:hypothetical protein
MDAPTRHERTLRLLEARLEALAVVTERAPGGARRYDRQIEGVFAATRHAVAQRHPGAGWCQTPPRLAA